MGKLISNNTEKKANRNINLHYWEDNRTELELKLSLFEDSHNYTTVNVKFCCCSSNHAHSRFFTVPKRNFVAFSELFQCDLF